MRIFKFFESTNHITRLHSHVVGLAVVAVHLDRPGLVDVLGHVDDAAAVGARAKGS